MTDEQIIEKVGFTNAADAVKQQMVDGIRAIVELRVIGVVDALLTDEQGEEFEKLQAAGDNDAIWTWLRESVVGVDTREIYEAALADYLEEYLANEYRP